MTNNANTQIIDNNAILNAFKNEFSTTVNVIHINSLNLDLKFREVSVTEQKTLSKTMIENENRKDVVYDTQCTLINRLCLDKVPKEVVDPETGEKHTELVDFDIYKLTEFDRIRLLMEIYQTNYFKNDITFKCPNCGCENVYQLDFKKISDKLNEFDLTDVTYTLEDRYRIYNFILNYPTVRNVSNFYKSYMKKYKNTNNKEREVLDNLGNIEYINLFIKQVEMINKADPTNKQVADLSIMTYNQIEQLISLFPQNIIFSEDKGVIKYITKQFIEKINNVFSYEKCAHCGAESTDGIGDMTGFFYS